MEKTISKIISGELHRKAGWIIVRTRTGFRKRSEARLQKRGDEESCYTTSEKSPEFLTARNGRVLCMNMLTIQGIGKTKKMKISRDVSVSSKVVQRFGGR